MKRKMILVHSLIACLMMNSSVALARQNLKNKELRDAFDQIQNSYLVKKNYQAFLIHIIDNIHEDVQFFENASFDREAYQNNTQDQLKNYLKTQWAGNDSHFTIHEMERKSFQGRSKSDKVSAIYTIKYDFTDPNGVVNVENGLLTIKLGVHLLNDGKMKYHFEKISAGDYDYGLDDYFFKNLDGEKITITEAVKRCTKKPQDCGFFEDIQEKITITEAVKRCTKKTQDCDFFEDIQPSTP
ncbi:MAG: hypothetical protein ACON5A_00485 [Candidatus Comchoanobacterales bacterium]